MENLDFNSFCYSSLEGKEYLSVLVSLAQAQNLSSHHITGVLFPLEKTHQKKKPQKPSIYFYCLFLKKEIKSNTSSK